MVSIWDRRASPRTSAAISGNLNPIDSFHGGAVLDFKRAIDITSKHDAIIRSVRYCRGKRGFFAVLSSAGQLKVYETKKEYSPSQSVGAHGPYSSHDIGSLEQPELL